MYGTLPGMPNDDSNIGTGRQGHADDMEGLQKVFLHVVVLHIGKITSILFIPTAGRNTPAQPITQLSLKTPSQYRPNNEETFITPSHPIKKLTTGQFDTPIIQTPSRLGTPSSPRTITKMFNESAMFARLIVAEEDPTYAANPIANDFTNSPLKPRLLVEVRLARSPWSYGVQHPVRDEIDIEPFYNWMKNTVRTDIVLARYWDYFYFNFVLSSGLNFLSTNNFLKFYY